MNRLRKAATTLALTGAMALTAGPALAHVCTNTNKAAGAGSAAVASMELTDGTFTFIEGDVNPQGHIKGGFLTIQVLLEGEQVAEFDTYTHLTLPEMALNAGSGGDECDGMGIDNAEACLMEMLAS